MIVGYGNIEIDPDMVAAVKTEKGIVIIDSGMSPTLAAKYKTIIETEFGSSDFKYVINTHHHDDHINGNQVFKEAEIITHHNEPEKMKEDYQNIAPYVKSRKERNVRIDELLATLEIDSDQYKHLKDWIYPFRKMCEDYESGFRLTLPSLTFTNNINLDMGDVNIELFYFGPGFHSDNDILISIPEEKVVFTGDLVHLRNQYALENSESNFDPWIVCLAEMFQANNDVKHVVAYHQGLIPETTLFDFHTVLKNMRENQQKKANAVNELRSMISQRSLKDAVQEFRDRFVTRRNKEYYIWEADMTLLAGEYQAQKKI